MKVYGKRLLIRPRVKKKNDTGLIMPDKKDIEMWKGFVVASGDGVDAPSGSEVLYNPYPHTDVEIEGSTLHLIDEENLLIIY